MKRSISNFILASKTLYIALFQESYVMKSCFSHPYKVSRFSPEQIYLLLDFLKWSREHKWFKLADRLKNSIKQAGYFWTPPKGNFESNLLGTRFQELELRIKKDGVHEVEGFIHHGASELLGDRTQIYLSI